MTAISTAFGLIGHPLGHSISPQIHAALGNPDYALYPLEPDQLAEFLADSRLRGLNVTIPYKRAVIPFCTSLDPEAEAIGSVNTLVRQPDGAWKGYNTDAFGLRQMMRAAGLSFASQDVLILGNGGVSQTVQAVAAADGAASVTVLSRSGAHTYADLPQYYPVSTLIVNATPVGMYPNAGQSLVGPEKFTRLRGVADLIYNPARTALMQRARACGIPCAGGLTMLVAQAKAAAELFSGSAIADDRIAQIGAEMQRDAENIVLIGMPGSGKTVIGEALGRLTQRRVIDTDAEIVRTAGKPIPQIFREDGEDAFRTLETEAIRRAGAERGIILVTGGGAVTRRENTEPLRSNGRIYRICRPTSELSRDGRPLSQGADLEQMAAVRMPLYQALADCAVENNRTPQDAAAEIWSDFCAYSRAEWTEFESAGHPGAGALRDGDAR